MLTLASIDRTTLARFSAWLASEHLDAHCDAPRQWLADAVSAELSRRDKRHRPAAAAIEIPDWTVEQLGEALGLTVALCAGAGNATAELQTFLGEIHFTLAALAAAVLKEGIKANG